MNHCAILYDSLCLVTLSLISYNIQYYANHFDRKDKCRLDDMGIELRKPLCWSDAKPFVTIVLVIN